MTTRQEAIDAAKKLPGNRSVAEQAIVDRNKGDQAVRNADHEAQRHQRIHGR